MRTPFRIALLLATLLPSSARAEDAAPAAHLAAVMSSRFCADCHPDIYAEHAQNTHGRAFTDEEVRLATGRFGHGDCIRCHTPRPIFETGNGLNPQRRFHDLEEGNSCMTCHWKPDYDYSKFQGGKECDGAFDPRVGEVEACASCHRNHGTPYQWEKSPNGKAADRTCMDCHMAKVKRPVAVGEPPRLVASHVFPGSRSVAHVDRAYRYEARIEGNEAVVVVTNKGAGHNFPTELKQRSVESLVVVRDASGAEVARSRMVFRDPYKRPYGLQLPINTQIPSGESREHRVPLPVAAGSVECELHFKQYFPIEDYHPDLARLLQAKVLPFDGVTPSTKPIETEPEVAMKTPESVAPEVASVANLVDFARPPIGTVAVEIPAGSEPADIQRLIDLFQFPVPEANGAARKRLVEIGEPALPALITGLGSWDNKTFNQSMAVLEQIGERAVPAVIAALDHAELYVRFHARALLPRMGYVGGDPAVEASLVRALGAANALDRMSAADALGALGYRARAAELERALADLDPDVVRSAARALARLGAAAAAPAVEAALKRAPWPETRFDLAAALADLGSAAGIATLLEGLDYPDDLIRENCFESFFKVVGWHLGYEPLAPREDRLAAIGRLQAKWAAEGSADLLIQHNRVPPAKAQRAWKLVESLAGGTGDAPPIATDEAAQEELRKMGPDAVPALVLGLKFPPGFADKRAMICGLLGDIRSPDAVPALAATLRDPVVGVAAWGCFALEAIADPESLYALKRYDDRLRTLIARGQLPVEVGSGDALLAQAGAARLACGDPRAREALCALLLSQDAGARAAAIDALEKKFGDRRGYDPEAAVEERRAAVRRWLE